MNHTCWFETRRQLFYHVIYAEILSQSWYGSQKPQLNIWNLFHVKNPIACVEHEASTSKIGEYQLFYLEGDRSREGNDNYQKYFVGLYLMKSH